jgi:hypothetical protein
VWLPDHIQRGDSPGQPVLLRRCQGHLSLVRGGQQATQGCSHLGDRFVTHAVTPLMTWIVPPSQAQRRLVASLNNSAAGPSRWLNIWPSGPELDAARGSLWVSQSP